MSTGNLGPDLLLVLGKIRDNALGENLPSQETLETIKRRFPSLTDQELLDIYAIVSAAHPTKQMEKAKLVLTAPPSFSVKAQSTKNAVTKMIVEARNSITITGYSLSEYFEDMIDKIVEKSKMGVYVKFFVNDIDKQSQFDKLRRHKGKFLKIYNYKNKEDHMSALHAKVISTDSKLTLITSANLSYHGQQGNIEMGALIESAAFAKQIDDVFTQLLFSKVFIEV